MSRKKGSDVEQFLEWTRQTMCAWLATNSKVVKAERLSPKNRKYVAFFLLQKAVREQDIRAA